ncbi:hypothetical protein, partial [Dysgonomonas sp. GY617]|uniref:hypothetical protein n=1 Tax=Dysgonomonas sp. GY617 TaxID=2780420 RepID=UPI001A7EF9F4
IDSCSGKGFRVADLFFCCRSKSVRYFLLLMAQLCPAAACRDYMLLLSLNKLTNYIITNK